MPRCRFYRKGTTMIKNLWFSYKKYGFLLKQLIIRDFKVKYKRSVLGVLWSLLYPLLMTLVFIISVSYLASGTYNPFIYFNF